MKLSVVVILTIFAVVSAEYGSYVPKAFYKIDENGQASPLYLIDLPEEQIHPRFRRSPQFNNQQQFGFPNNQFGFGNFPGFPPVAGGNFQGVSTSQTVGGTTLTGRFGDDEPVITGQSTTFNSGADGKFTETTHTLGRDGKWKTHQNRGSFQSTAPLANRFGEDEGPVVQGQTTTFTGQNGQFTQTTHVFGSDGKVQTTVNKGKV